MTEQKQVEMVIEAAVNTLEQAREVYMDSQRVQQGDPAMYSQAQSNLEDVHGNLETLLRVATPEQREQLERTQLQLRQLQNQMIMKR